jgi:nucleotide-binding universal stress UspA family protein
MFTKILVPLDQSPLAEQALGQASAVAKASHAAMDLLLVHQALPFAGFGDAPWNAEQQNDEQMYLRALADEVASGATVPVKCVVLRGEPVETICAQAREVEADLIVMTTHGRTGLSRSWLGSVADGVLRHSSIPVLMLRPIEGKARRIAAHHLFKTILVPVDDSAASADILPSATSLARCSNARVLLLRVVQPVPLLMTDLAMPFASPPVIADEPATAGVVAEARQQLDDLAGRMRDVGVVDVGVHVVVATHVARALLEFAPQHDVDAIAMSTHGRGMSRLFVGSVADKVLRGSSVPMLLHHPLAIAAAVGAPGVSVVDAPTLASTLMV